jgi:O-acetyl-ADP-ribose deacetylase (regulator of RNase III)
MSCSGNGVLDAAIFKAGGLTMQEDCTKFGILKEGGVRLSQGYLLPCRHVIHTVPPEFYNNRTEPLLRSCYRDALKMAVDIGARTIAFPAIGSGLLMFPREAAQVGVIEMRNFLDQNPDTRIEKILICVFGEHEDNIYRKLLP